MSDEVDGAVAPAATTTTNPLRPMWAAVLGLVLAVIGAAMACVGARQSGILLMGFGAVVGVVGLGVLSWWTRAWAAGHRRWAAVGGGIGVGVGIAFVWFALAEDVQALAIVGVAVAVLGSLPLAGSFRLARLPGPPPLWIVVGFAAVALGLLLSTTWRVWVGLTLSLAGLIVYKLGLQSLDAPTTTRRRALSVAIMLLGAVLLIVGAFATSGPIAATGGFLLGMGLLAATATIAPDPGPAPSMTPAVVRWGLILAVLVIVVGATEWLIGATFSAEVTIGIIIILLLGIGASFVVRGESLVFLLVAGIAVIWVSLGRVDESSPDRHADSAARILALGDSYISGEGAPTFYENTNEKGADGDQCRRSPTAYPVLVADELEMGLDFLACSGAKTVSLGEDGKRDESDPNDLVAQLADAETLDKDSIRVVLLSIGGNDAEFGDIGKACLVPGSCKELRQLWLENVGQIGIRITEAYTKVRAAFPNAAVIVVPYPLLIDVDNCSWSLLAADEHAFVGEFIAVLDDQLNASAALAGVRVLDDALFAFDERQICDGKSPDDSVMNVINVNPVNGSISSRLNPTNWFHGSLHPKASGHRLIADALELQIPKVLEEVETSGTANPEPDPSAVFTLRGIAGAARALFSPDDVPSGFTCPAPGPFAERAQVVDERAFIPLDADPDAPVCFTDASGTWRQATPTAASGALGRAGPGDVIRTGEGAVSIRLNEPTTGDDRQWVLYTPAAGAAGDGSETGQPQATQPSGARRSNLMLVDFCQLDPSCKVANVTTWRNEKVVDALQRALVPSTLLLLGAWGLVLWIRLKFWP